MMTSPAETVTGNFKTSQKQGIRNNGVTSSICGLLCVIATLIVTIIIVCKKKEKENDTNITKKVVQVIVCEVHINNINNKK